MKKFIRIILCLLLLLSSSCDPRYSLSNDKTCEFYNFAINKLTLSNNIDYVYENADTNLIIVRNTNVIKTNNLSKCKEEFDRDFPTIKRFSSFFTNNTPIKKEGFYTKATITQSIFCKFKKDAVFQNFNIKTEDIDILFYKNSNIEFTVMKVNENANSSVAIRLIIGNEINLNNYLDTEFFDFYF